MSSTNLFTTSDLSQLSSMPNFSGTIELDSKSNKNCKRKNKHECKCKPKCEKHSSSCSSKCLTPEQILYLSRNAVVEVHSEFILLGASGPGADIRAADISLQPLLPNTRADIVLEGNGFFIEQHYIITPAHLVLLPPSLTSVANRYPFVHPQAFNEQTRISNLMIRASRILITVLNVNNKKHSFVYEAELVGVDGAGDIAILRIKTCSQWNFCNPCIEECHPHLQFGCSSKIVSGEKVYLLGNQVSGANNMRRFNSVVSISQGLLANNQHVDYSGLILAETILVSAPNYNFSSGLPILDCQGCVIGMQTINSCCKEFVSGPSKHFMHRVIKTLIQGLCQDKCNEHIELICDPIGNYYRYRKAYLGITYEVLSGVDYDVTIDYTSSTNVIGVPRIRLDANGEFMNSPSCKEIMGIRVLGVAGVNPNNDVNINNGLYYVPGGESLAPLLNNLPVSPLIGKIQPGDIITHINDIPIGNMCKQVSPAVILWRCVSGQQITITYRSGGNFVGSDSNDLTGNYDNLHKYTIFASDYPLGLDYPWYAIDIFPLLATLPYPGFIFNNQLAQPQLPQLAKSQTHFRGVI